MFKAQHSCAFYCSSDCETVLDPAVPVAVLRLSSMLGQHEQTPCVVELNNHKKNGSEAVRRNCSSWFSSADRKCYVSFSPPVAKLQHSRAVRSVD